MDLPDPLDENYPVGAKIWLILSTHYEDTNNEIIQMYWNPTDYLFESNLITYDDTDYS